MSSDIEKKLENLFNISNENVGDEKLQHLIKEVYMRSLTEKSLMRTQAQPKLLSQDEILRLLPQFEFNETIVGSVDTGDRKQFEMFMGPKLRSAKDLKAKINIINNFANSPQVTSNNTQDVLSSLMMLKILKNIIVGSQPGPSGYQFEAFFAALFGGQQIKASEGGAVDVVINNTNYQLKLLQKGGRVRVKSVDINKTKETVETLNFIIANKESDKKVTFYSMENVAPKIVGDKKEFSLNYPEYSTSERLVGQIDISDEAFKKLSEQLKSNVIFLLSQTADLVNNINKFYFNNSTSSAREGISNTNNIKNSLTKQL